MNAKRYHQYVGLVPPAPTQMEIISVHAQMGLKWLMEAVLVNCKTHKLSKILLQQDLNLKSFSVQKNINSSL